MIVGIIVIKLSFRFLFFFFFNDTATTEIYTLSLHDALPISVRRTEGARREAQSHRPRALRRLRGGDRKSTRLNSSHSQISYAVFCLKKKKIAPRGTRFVYVPPKLISGTARAVRERFAVVVDN